MVLHSAVHRFTEGEQPRALRDLIDIHELVSHFAGRDPAFWTHLTSRAVQLGLTRPLYYAIRYCRRLLMTQVPADALQEIERFAPPLPLRLLMDSIVPRAFMPDGSIGADVSTWLMFVRGHYLRMPWRLLVPHLTRKTLRRLRHDTSAAADLPA
jgi:hypothetical protein